MKGLPHIALGDLVKQIDRAESVRAEATYKLLGVRLEGRGAFHRETVLGSETSASRLSRVEEGDFIYSRLFAWRGAFGVINSDLEGCFVSNEFPLFRVDESRLDVQFLNRWFQLPEVWRLVEQDCTGSTPTTRNRFKEEFFRKLRIPLPPLREQQLLVAHVDAVTDRVRQLANRLDALESNADRLLIALATRSDLSDAERKARGWSELYLGDVLHQSSDAVAVQASGSYPNVGVLSFARGLFTKVPIDGSVTSASTLYRIRQGQFVYSRLFAFEGAYAVVQKEHDGAFVSNEFPAFDIDQELASPALLYAYFRSPRVWEAITHGSKGLGDRRQRVQPSQLLSHRFWLPPKEVLRRLDAIVPLVVDLKTRNASIREANATVIPATMNRLFAGVGSKSAVGAVRPAA